MNKQINLMNFATSDKGFKNISNTDNSRDTIAKPNPSDKVEAKNEEKIDIGLLGFGTVIRIPPIKGNIIGFLENGIFTCDRKLSGKFRRFNGFGMSKQLIRELIQVSAKKIIFRIFDEGKVVYILEVSPLNFSRRGIDYFNPALKEDQLVLPETSWDRKIVSSLQVVR